MLVYSQQVMAGMDHFVLLAIPFFVLAGLIMWIAPWGTVTLLHFYYNLRQNVDVDSLYSMSTAGRYWYSGGYNRKAVGALIPAALVPIRLPWMAWLPAAT